MDHIEFAYCLNGLDAGRQLHSEEEIVARLKADQLAWLHMQADHPETDSWMESILDFIEPTTRAALLADATRPRTLVQEDGLVVMLRGVNLNPGEEAEDMISLRMFLNPARIITLSRRPLKSVAALEKAIVAGKGPTTAGNFLVALIEGLGERMEQVMDELGERVDVLEDEVIAQPMTEHRAQVLDARQQTIDLRRHLGPQRDAVAALMARGHVVLAKPDRRRLNEAHDRLVRTVEELDAIRDRLIVLKDEIEAVAQDQLNSNLFLLSILSAIFLPLGFLTGLMGINLAGMPGAQHPWAFWAFTGLLCAVAALQLLILRRLKWI